VRQRVKTTNCTTATASRICTRPDISIRGKGRAFKKSPPPMALFFPRGDFGRYPHPSPRGDQTVCNQPCLPRPRTVLEKPRRAHAQHPTHRAGGANRIVNLTLTPERPARTSQTAPMAWTLHLPLGRTNSGDAHARKRDRTVPPEPGAGAGLNETSI
jgi:hypothetical protein